MDPQLNAMASGSSLKPKRKHSGDDEFDQELPQNPYQQLDQRQFASIPLPPNKRRATNTEANFALPDLVPDHSNSASDDDIAMDQDQDGDRSLDSPVGGDDDYAEGIGGCGIGMGRNFAYNSSGSGGFGFGPGAEEDDMMGDQEQAMSLQEGDPKNYPTVYPSLTPHPNPNHFSNFAPFTNNSSNSLKPSSETNGIAGMARPTSPLSAQPFTTALSAPPAPASRGGLGLLQPVMNGPLGPDASAIERARAAHGPQCQSIPQLKISPYPDPATGNQTMYSLCPDCGTIEKV